MCQIGPGVGVLCRTSMGGPVVVAAARPNGGALTYLAVDAAEGIGIYWMAVGPTVSSVAVAVHGRGGDNQYADSYHPGNDDSPALVDGWHLIDFSGMGLQDDKQLVVTATAFNQEGQVIERRVTELCS